MKIFGKRNYYSILCTNLSQIDEMKDKLKCFKFLSAKGHNCCKICQT